MTLCKSLGIDLYRLESQRAIQQVWDVMGVGLFLRLFLSLVLLSLSFPLILVFSGWFFVLLLFKGVRRYSLEIKVKFN